MKIEIWDNALKNGRIEINGRADEDRQIMILLSIFGEVSIF